MSSQVRQKPASVLICCPSCTARTRLPLPPPSSPCRSCGRPLPLQGAGAFRPAEPLASCVCCGDDKLYTQKDLHQGVGCAVLAAGAILVPWTWGLSLGVCALLDYLLYRRLAPLTVCYVCDARYRGLPPHPDHRPYELMSAQTWEARRLNWRRLNDRSPAGVDTNRPPP